MKDSGNIKIAIHRSENSFSDYWIKYCDQNHIKWKLVDCYKDNIIQQLSDCDALMWHFHHKSHRAVIFAKQLIFSMQVCGLHTFPDFNTIWHFDDKIGQKYLLESLNLPLVPSHVFYSKQEAMEWISTAMFPLVFKLRNGSSSDNVYLLKNRKIAVKYINKAFGKGFKQYEALRSLRERYRKYRKGLSGFSDVLKGLIRIAFPTKYSSTKGKEKGYVYFQDFIPGNDHDIRIIVIGNRALGVKRMVRKNDFRASGSGDLHYHPSLFPMEAVRLAFDIVDKLEAQCLAMDFIMFDGKPKIIEISYGFPWKNFIEKCTGYWDKELQWHEEEFNPYGWMVENLISKIKSYS